VEAGRPDTITPDKLAALKKMGATRISINPQTLNDRALRAIGRAHTAADFLNAFDLAREYGFFNINTDIIAGLPRDGIDDFKNTLSEVLRLSPESVTVHTLAIKRSSSLASGPGQVDENTETVSSILAAAKAGLEGAAYHPYYMYRQSKTLGNLENVGWAREGFESAYNVYMMDELQTILAAGAGAVTRLKQPRGDYIERVFNYKYPFEYVKGFDEMIKRKEKIYSFYEQYKQEMGI